MTVTLILSWSKGATGLDGMCMSKVTLTRVVRMDDVVEKRHTTML